MAGALPLYGMWMMSVPVSWIEHVARHVDAGAVAARGVVELSGLCSSRGRSRPATHFAGTDGCTTSTLESETDVRDRGEVLVRSNGIFA